MKRKDGKPKKKIERTFSMNGIIKDYVINYYKNNESMYSFAKKYNLKYNSVKATVRNLRPL